MNEYTFENAPFDRERLLKQLEELPQYKGKNVLVVYVVGGQVGTEKGKLKGVEPFKCIELENGPSIPLIGNFAIREVRDIESGRIVLLNSKIKKDFNRTKSYDIRKECGFPEPSSKLL